MFKFLTYATLCFLINASAFGQDVTATASVDSSSLLVGNQLTLRLSVQHPAGVTVEWPAVADSLHGLEVVKAGKPGQVAGANATDTAAYLVAAFDTGTAVIPPLPFAYTVAGDTNKRVAYTQAIPVFVRGIAVDTSLEIKEIKGPKSVPITWADLWPWMLAITVIVALGWLIWYVIKKRAKGESIIPEAPRRPAHEIALDALRSLESEKMWQRGLVKEYHSKLTDVLREYIEKRYSVMALELTTDEIMDGLKGAPIAADNRKHLYDILNRADFAKFAKFQPAPQENELSMAQAVDFIQATWRQPVPVVQHTAPDPAMTAAVESAPEAGAGKDRAVV